MSDYVESKVIRLPFPKSILKECSTDDPYDCESYLKDKLGDLWGDSLKQFRIECTDKNYYIDYVYYDTYGESSGDFGHVQYLSEKELNMIKPLFQKITNEFKDTDLRKVHYSYYNCCECTDYYDIIELKDDELL